MNDNYLVDLRHLIDLNKTKVYIDISSCMQYSYPTEAMDDLVNLLVGMRQYISHTFNQTDMNIFNDLLEKVKDNRDYLYELDEYICHCNKQLKKDKGWSEDDSASVGIPKSNFQITLEELIVFYNVLEEFEKNYNIIKPSITGLWGAKSYFYDVRAIKDTLQERLTYAIVSTRNFYR